MPEDFSAFAVPVEEPLDFSQESEAIKPILDFSQDSVPVKQPGGLLTQLGIGLSQGIPQLGQQANSILQAATKVPPAFGGGGLGMVNLLTGGALEDQFRGASEISGEWAGQLEQLGEATEGPKLARRLGAGAGSIAPAIAAAPLGIPAAIAASALQSFGGTYGDAQKAYREQGLTPEQAEQKARIPAIASGLSTAAVTALFGKIAPGVEGWTSALAVKGFLPAIKSVLKNAGVEATEEGVDQLNQAVIQKLSYNPAMTLQQALSDALEAGVVGGVLGGGLSAIRQATPPSTPPPLPPSGDNMWATTPPATPEVTIPIKPLDEVPWVEPPPTVAESATVEIDPVTGRQRVADYVDEPGEVVVTGEELKPPPVVNESFTTSPPLPPTAETPPVQLAPADSEPKGPGMIGMGGAVPSEFVNSPNTWTSIKNAQVDIERAKRGLPSAIQPAKRDFGTVWDDAMAILDNDPGASERLVAELSSYSEPRQLTDTEVALLLHRQIDLQNESGKADQELRQAFDDGRTTDAELIQARRTRLSDSLLDVYNAGKRGGTETARGLNARKLLAYEDFSLANLETQARSARGGRPLTDTERADLVKIANDFKTKSEELEKAVAARDEKLAIAAFDAAQAQMIADAKAESAASPYIISIAEKIVSNLDSRAAKARIRLKEKLRRTSAAIDPTILLDVAEIGASHIGHVSLDFTKWSARMIEDVGDWIKPYLDEVFKASKSIVDVEDDRLTKGQSDTVKDGVKRKSKGGKADTTEEITDQLQAKVSSDDQAGIGPLIQRLARAFVSQGITERNALIDAVHSAIQPIMPDMTRRQAMDAISGYGDFKQLSKDEISVQLRDLKGQMQQVGKLDDMKAGQAPKKTGVERRSPSDEERRLTKQVEEAKRKGGYKVTDPATQLRSALQSIQARLANQISDLEYEILTKTRIVRQKTATPTSPEIEALKAKRDALKTERDSIFGKREMTDEQRIKLATAALERSISDYEAKIKAGDISPSKKETTPSTPELEALRSRRDALREQLQEMRDLANPKKTPEERANQAYKTRTANRIAELQEKLAAGDFKPKTKKTFTRDPESEKLAFELEKVKQRYYEGLIKARLEARSAAQKVVGGIGEVLNFFRALKTSFDLSAVGRQGFFIGLAHPARAAKSLPAMFRALVSPQAEHAIIEEIIARKNFPLYKKSGLFISHARGNLSEMEEAYMSRWASKVPGIAASNRAYTTFLNKLRADSFDAMIANLAKDGTPTDVEAKAIANFINVATGRGSFGEKNNAGVVLATVFFSPRYLASRFQLLTAQPLYGGSARTRKMVAQEYAKVLGGIALIYAMASMMDDDDIETDPRSSDFGKIKVGETRIDPMAGLLQATVFLSRVSTGETKNLKGKLSALRGEERKFGGQSVMDVLGSFLRSKLSPAIGLGVTIASGENMIGEPVTKEYLAKELLVPITPLDIYKAMKENGIPAGMALGVLSIFGVGLQVHEDKKSDRN